MPNQLNPFTAPLSAIKQMGEQANVAIQSLGTGMTRATSQTLDALMGGLPGLPGLPGTPGAPAPAMNAGLPTGALMPANLTQALGQVENLLIPPGLPRPSQVLAGVTPPTPTPPPTPPPVERLDAGTVATRRRVSERRGL